MIHMVGSTRGTPEGFNHGQTSGSQQPPPSSPNLAEVMALLTELIRQLVQGQQKESYLLRSMVPAIRQTLTLWSEAMHLRPRVRRSCETAGAGYQRSLDIPVPGECDHHVLAAKSVAGFVAPALVNVAARSARP